MKFPRQIKYIVGNEAAERFSFYGMQSILVIFMTQNLRMADSDAKASYHLFVAACYLLPLFGAYLSDRYWGKYKTIMYLSLFYCLGHGALALFEGKVWGLYLGLGFIAIGAGGIKPCVSANVGDQFTEKNKELLEVVYNIFYWSINFGSFFATLMIPWVLARYGAAMAFGIPGILMAVATFYFWKGKKYYVMVPPTGKTGGTSFGKALFDYCFGKKSKMKREDVESTEALLSILKIFVPISVFWALYFQQGSSWVLQANSMDLRFLGVRWEASQIQALNPILILVFIPVFSKWVYPAIEKFGFKMTALRKMTGGMFLTGLSFLCVGIIQTTLDSGVRLNVGWQFIPYFILTAAEIMVSVTGLEFAYTQAPKSMKSTVMSLWLLNFFVGNLLTAWISKINVFQGDMYFYFFACLVLVVSFVFMMIAKNYKMKNYMVTT
jgi:POT family proton-dependent oligopeptide transporter